MKIYVGNLAKEVTEAQLTDLVTPYGTPVSSNIATDSAGSRGFGFVEFGTAEQAQAAINALNGRELNGQSLKVSEARPRKEKVHVSAE
jgi:RNA recognition motif-containing protein